MRRLIEVSTKRISASYRHKMSSNDDLKSHMIYAFHSTADRFKDHYNQNEQKLLKRGTKLDYRLGYESDLVAYFSYETGKITHSHPLYKELLPIMRGGVLDVNPIAVIPTGRYVFRDRDTVLKYNKVLSDYAIIDLKIMFEIYPLFDNFAERQRMLDSINAAQPFPDFNRGDRHIAHTFFKAFNNADAEIEKWYGTHIYPYTIKPAHPRHNAILSNAKKSPP